jgi:murein DD-endopeptidase MepM/ murein hydrolase activator NlpD
MKRGRAGLAAVGAILALGLGLVGQTAAGVPAQTFTPVIQDVLSKPSWYRGIDNRVHIEYELQLINGFPVPAEVTSIVVRRGGGGVLVELTGAALNEAISPIGFPGERTTTIPPGGGAIAFIDLTVAAPDRLPRRISHALSTEIEPGLPVPAENTAVGARARVVQTRPVRIDAPLGGDRWAAVIGAHRRSVQPVNGRLTNGQRYAIDWNRLDEQDRPAFGDPATFDSNPSYGAPVLAVGDAKVVEAVDGIADQPPDSFTPVGPEIADGNVVVLRLAPGVFVGYAHLIPGSVRVRTGDRVESGDELGLLGNSGNSNGPHLHFQIMDSPSLLDSESLPFVIREFGLRGIVPSLDAFGEAYATQSPVPYSTAGAGPYRNRGPVGLPILDLPQGAA